MHLDNCCKRGLCSDNKIKAFKKKETIRFWVVVVVGGVNMAWSDKQMVLH